jgi:hypothetical protein
MYIYVHMFTCIGFGSEEEEAGGKKGIKPFFNWIRYFYMYIYVFIYIYVYVWIYVWMHTYIYIYLYMYMNLFVYTWINVYIHSADGDIVTARGAVLYTGTFSVFNTKRVLRNTVGNSYSWREFNVYIIYTYICISERYKSNIVLTVISLRLEVGGVAWRCGKEISRHRKLMLKHQVLCFS